MSEVLFMLTPDSCLFPGTTSYKVLLVPDQGWLLSTEPWISHLAQAGKFKTSMNIKIDSRNAEKKRIFVEYFIVD